MVLFIFKLSPILDFYPTDFTVDANGKKYSWQGVALLPFVDEARLRKGLEPVYHKLTEEEGEKKIYLKKYIYILLIYSKW